MGIVKSLVRGDGGFERSVGVGDVLLNQDGTATLTTVGAGTLLAAALMSDIIERTGPTAAFNDTTDSAANIMLAASGTYSTSGLINVGSPLISVGDNWRVRYVNNVAFAGTIVGGTGVTVVNPTVNASSVKDFSISCTAGGEQTIVAVAQTNGSALLTGLTLQQTSQIQVGMSATGTNIPASTTVISVQPGVGVTLSANATATIAINAITFSPTFTLTGIGQGLL